MADRPYSEEVILLRRGLCTWPDTKRACLQGILGYGLMLVPVVILMAAFGQFALVAALCIVVGAVLSLLVILLAVAYSLYSFALWGARARLDRLEKDRSN